MQTSRCCATARSTSGCRSAVRWSKLTTMQRSSRLSRRTARVADLDAAPDQPLLDERLAGGVDDDVRAEAARVELASGELRQRRDGLHADHRDRERVERAAVVAVQVDAAARRFGQFARQLSVGDRELAPAGRGDDRRLLRVGGRRRAVVQHRRQLADRQPGEVADVVALHERVAAVPGTPNQPSSVSASGSPPIALTG